MSPPRKSYDAGRFSRYARALEQAVANMKTIRITEPVYFLGEQRKPGDVLHAEMGPYRTETIPGGLKRIAQFVEMPEEIKQVIEQATQAAPLMDTGTAANAMPAVSVNAAPAAKVAPKANPLAARIRGLTTRRAKFQDYAAKLLDDGEKAMGDIETHGPLILERSVQASQDELTAISDLGDSLKEMDRANGGPL